MAEPLCSISSRWTFWPAGPVDLVRHKLHAEDGPGRGVGFFDGAGELLNAAALAAASSLRGSAP